MTPDEVAAMKVPELKERIEQMGAELKTKHVAVQQGNDTIQKLEGEIRTKIAPLSDKVSPSTLL